MSPTSEEKNNEKQIVALHNFTVVAANDAVPLINDLLAEVERLKRTLRQHGRRPESRPPERGLRNLRYLVQG